MLYAHNVMHACRKERDAAHTCTETVLYHSVGPATMVKPRDGDGLYPMNQINQYAEVSSPYTEIGELEDRQGRERALSNGLQHKNSEVGCFSVIMHVDSIHIF